MGNFLFKAREFFLDILFPKFCVNCGKEGSYLCPDCFSLIEILDRQYCPFCEPPKVVFDGKTCVSCKRSKNLHGLFCASSYDNFIIKKLVRQFKYEPFLKELSSTLASLIITHLSLVNKTNFESFALIPVPLHIKRLKFRGFNPAEEIAKELSKDLKISLLSDALVKMKQTPPQMELKKEERKENIRNVFVCKKPEIIKNQKILLVDDVFTTGSTMEECAKVLKDSGAKEVWGVVVARG